MGRRSAPTVNARPHETEIIEDRQTLTEPDPLRWIDLDPYRIYTVEECSRLLGLQPAYFAIMRRSGEGPGWFRYAQSHGPVRYCRRDVIEWVCRQREAHGLPPFFEGE